MPKIIIREDDATSAGIGLYTNFSVLVPGFVKNTEAFEDAADDNDVYEVSTKKDFIEKFGLIDEYMSSKKYNVFASILKKSNVEVVSETNIIFSYKNNFDAVIFNKNMDEIDQFVSKIFKKK